MDKVYVVMGQWWDYDCNDSWIVVAMHTKQAADVVAAKCLDLAVTRQVEEFSGEYRQKMWRTALDPHGWPVDCPVEYSVHETELRTE